ncbi:MAG TPA: hypothetical protein VFW11_20140 [Cyclobacteriaceae bacterium]|nr:hypothetical protein [Cyclobacteriaceae bacterium]
MAPNKAGRGSPNGLQLRFEKIFLQSKGFDPGLNQRWVYFSFVRILHTRKTSFIPSRQGPGQAG